jgi:hypothetical protein
MGALKSLTGEENNEGLNFSFFGFPKMENGDWVPILDYGVQRGL